MADLGSIGTKGAFTYQNEDIAPRQIVHRGICIGRLTTPLVMGAKDVSVGNGAQPSLRLDARGYFKLYWTVKAGIRTFNIYVKQAANLDPRPRITIVKNAAIGQATDVTYDAGAGTGWIFCAPIITSTLSADGVLEVRLENRLSAAVGSAPCYWDDISTS